MSNTWTYSGSYKGSTLKQNTTSSDYQERQRKETAERVVRNYMSRFLSQYPPLLAKEYMSLLFRQRGVPSVDMFTFEIINSFRSSLGFPQGAEDVLRRILILGKWRNSTTCVTMWTIEPVIASMCVDGNTIDVTAAKERFSGEIEVIEPLTTTTPMTTVVNNQIRGRMAGWITWKEVVRTRGGTPSCVSCNMCGPSIMFAVHRRGSKMIQMKMTPESVISLSNYCPALSTKTGATPHLLTHPSTRLKIQPGMYRPRSTALTLYGNGSMQFSGSPKEIEFLYPCLVELVKMVMNAEMVTFLSTMRRMDVDMI
jgi:hypothetical protein